VCAERLNEPRIWVAIRNFFVFHLLRRYPSWFGWLPAHAQKLALARDRLPDGTEETEEERARAVGAGQGHSPAMRPSVWARRRA
jgi:cardiolipin synthase